MRSSNCGFTLFEVLGAVAILAILYTTLSVVAIRGLRSEGESRRMLEASLLADLELSDFELDLETGAAPEIGVTESEDDKGFKVTWEVTPLETAIFRAPATQQPRTLASDPAARQTPVPIVDLGATGESAPPFLRVDLTVSWLEAGNERWVTRTIFAVDEDAAARFAASTALNEGGSGGGQR